MYAAEPHRRKLKHKAMLKVKRRTRRQRQFVLERLPRHPNLSTIGSNGSNPLRKCRQGTYSESTKYTKTRTPLLFITDRDIGNLLANQREVCVIQAMQG